LIIPCGFRKRFRFKSEISNLGFLRGVLGWVIKELFIFFDLFGA
jgi:hypothetical protein